MRKSKVETEATRGRIVTTAARLFRKNGIATVGIAELMQRAGLTHGGFYKHFPSKEALVAEACGHALDEKRSELTEAAENAPQGAALEALVTRYLSPIHRDHPEAGCAIAALGGEAARGDSNTRQTLEAGTERLVELVASQLDGGAAETRRAEARGIVASMVGGLIMARATQDAGQSEAVLRNVREFILKRAL